MSINDDIAELREALNRRNGVIVWTHWLPTFKERCLNDEITNVLDEIERLREATRWRDAVTEPPDEGVTVAARYGDGRVFAGHKAALEHWWWDSYNATASNDITHWVPLPEPPAQQEAGA